MKNKKSKAANYSKLKKKIFLRVFGMIMSAALLIGCVYTLFWKGRVGDWIVMLFQALFRIDREAALVLYSRIFRENFEFLMFGAILILFFIMFSFFLSWFTKYFKEIDRGIDSLVSNKSEKIVLLPEMKAIEKKLNTVQQALQRKALETQMAEQRKNELVLYLAHDIRTPLTSVIGYLNLLEEGKDMPAEQRAKYLHITLEKAYRLEKLINEFFEITKYNSQQIKLEKEAVDLYYMLVQVADELYPALSSRGNKATIHTSEDLMIFGDPAKLARVFNNILKNAAAYSYPNTNIDIILATDGNMVRISFQNKGNTIPKDKLDRLFEKFYRLDEARVSDTGGSGLGLSIAQEIVAMHGGTIAASSENETVTFTVTLPVMG